MMKHFITLILVLITAPIALAVETTPYGRIVGIETRGGNLHVQTDFCGW